MLEHVGAANLPSYFASIARLRSPDGLALVHSIGVSGTPRRCNRWANKYIFPGGYLPALKQLTAAASQQGLKILDIEIMSGHYEETLKHWRRAFFANIAMARHHYDARFIRIPEFYLAGCECFSGHKLVWCYSIRSATIIPSRRWGAVTSQRQKTVTGIYCARRIFLATHPPRRNDPNGMGVIM